MIISSELIVYTFFVAKGLIIKIKFNYNNNIDNKNKRIKLFINSTIYLNFSILNNNFIFTNSI